MPWPDLWRVVGQGIVTAYAGIVLVTAFVFYGDNVSLRVPVGALGQGADIYAMDLWLLRGIWMALRS